MRVDRVRGECLIKIQCFSTPSVLKVPTIDRTSNVYLQVSHCIHFAHSTMIFFSVHYYISVCRVIKNVGAGMRDPTPAFLGVTFSELLGLVVEVPQFVLSLESKVWLSLPDT